MSTESFEYAESSRSHPARIGLGIALGAVVGSALGVATDNLALWLPALLGMGTALGVVLATR